jgi:hypothetical protein
MEFWSLTMNFKNQTINIVVTSVSDTINSSSGFVFNSENGDTYLLSTKHSFCPDFASCKDTQCSSCESKIDPSKIKSELEGFTISEVHQSKVSDIAIAKLGNKYNYDVVNVDHDRVRDCEFFSWRGGTEDRLVLESPNYDDADIRLDIKSNINAHKNEKNDEMPGFSGSPIHRFGKNGECLTAILSDSTGINDVTGVPLDRSLVNELEGYCGCKLFNWVKEVDILDKTMVELPSIVNSPLIQASALQRLIETSRKMHKEDPVYRDMLEELGEFLVPRAGREIIGLDGKLIEGKREELLEDATFLENKFARKVTKGQMSDTEEIVYFHCLSTIITCFRSYISPRIRSGDSDCVIDEAILDKIIKPLYEEISLVKPMTMEMISGMLYFLTGKCHIRWKK